MLKRNAMIWKVNPLNPAPEIIKKAADILRAGGLVAFPTETVYGLGASAFNSQALAAIFYVKGRPQDNPLIVHVADKQAVFRLASSVPERALKLINAFWPGPLTIVLPRRRDIPPEVSAGLDSVAIRMPAHEVALSLIKAASLPVAAPSANLSGCPSPTTAAHVLNDLGEHIDAILDGGPADMGIESTVLDLTAPVPVVLRPGGVTLDELADVLGEVKLDPAVVGDGQALEKEFLKPRSPGMKYRHYAPKAEMILVEGNPQKAVEQVKRLAVLKQNEGKKVGILASTESGGLYNQNMVLIAGSRKKPEQIASRLYSALRHFDELGVDVIVAEGIDPFGLGLAVMNRLRRAAGGKIIRV